MIDRVRDFFGIEGLRLGLAVDGQPRLSDERIAGELTLDCLREQAVTALTLVLTERYTRGRGAERLIDTYELGRLTQATSLTVAGGEQVVLPFDLRFSPRRTPLDEALAGRPLGTYAKRLAELTIAAGSAFELSATAEVAGAVVPATTRLPLDL